MALVPCSACHRRIVAKPIGVYTARFVEQQRVAYRLNLCFRCAEEYASTVKTAKPIDWSNTEGEWPDQCPICGGGTKDDLDPIYLTIYEPKREGITLTIPTCGTCTANIGPILEKGGRRLEDRQPRNGGPGSADPSSGEGAPSPLAWA